jgi:putative ABC transport system permease protein
MRFLAMRAHLRLALRSLRRRWPYALLNVGGLALGMLACLLIGLYVLDERSYDRFHEHAARIAQVGVGDGDERTLFGPFPLAEALDDFPSLVEASARTARRADAEVRVGTGPRLRDLRVAYAEPSFFSVFSFPALAGDPRRALDAPDGVVITASTATRLFGEAEALGGTIHLSARDYGQPGGPRGTLPLTVRAVVADPPRQSTVQFDVLAPHAAFPGLDAIREAWHVRSFHTHVLLRPGVTPDALETIMREAIVWEELQGRGESFALSLTGVYLSDLHDAPGVTGQRRFLYGLTLAALFLLAIAGINYVNVSTALSLRRVREIGVRKALGASRPRLAASFLAESAALSLLAVAVALLLTFALLPTFSDLLGTELAVGDRVPALLLLAAIVLGVGVAGGVYPASLAARFDPVRALRGQSVSGAAGTGGVRRALVLVQLAACATLLVGAYVIGAQLRYVQTADLGFDSEGVVVFELDVEGAWRARDVLQAAVGAIPEVVAASVARTAPGREAAAVPRPRETLSPEQRLDPETPIPLAEVAVDGHFAEVMGLRFLAGRGFDPARGRDPFTAVLINETAARAAGWTVEEAVGKPYHTLFSAMGMAAPREVIGVVADFHLSSFRHEVPAVILTHADASRITGGAGAVVVRLAPGAGPAAVEAVRAMLEPYVGEDAVLTHAFLDARFAALYDAERRLARVVGAFALAAVLVVCFGLFGLASLTTLQRRKEVAVRRVLGASVPGVAAHLSREFVVLVAVAVGAVGPLMYLGLSRWLEGFVYRIPLGPAPFVLSGLALLFLALVAVGYHTLSAARADPVHTLRAE